MGDVKWEQPTVVAGERLVLLRVDGELSELVHRRATGRPQASHGLATGGPWVVHRRA